MPFTSKHKPEKNSIEKLAVQYQSIPEADIDFSPLNYRTCISQAELEAFAEELMQHGIISPVTVRVITPGRYELVTGERRLRAGRIAGLTEIPAVVRELTDEQVVEIQLAENLQRENPHPMEEAQAIGRMQGVRRSVDQIAARLGKSKAFVFGRLKLLALLPDFQSMFLADHFILTEALQIATLSEESQQAFYDTYCKEWRKNGKPNFHNLGAILGQFKCDLKHAPFDTKDKGLLPDVGACTKCPYNSATLKSLFPDQAKDANCTKRECYEQKSLLTISLKLAEAIAKHQPVALLDGSYIADNLAAAIAAVPGAESLPIYTLRDVNTWDPPVLPGREEFEEAADYMQAMTEYEEEKVEFARLLLDGKLLKGVVIADGKIEEVLFDLDLESNCPANTDVKAADVRAAIRGGTATPVLLQAEINRIQTREARSLELDRDKVQERIHTLLNELICDEENVATLTDADLAAARWLVYQSIGYNLRYIVENALFAGKEDQLDRNEFFYELCRDMTEPQFAYLIRAAVLSQPESKVPGRPTGHFLYKVADQAGIDVVSVEEEQQQKADVRAERQQAKIVELEKKIDKMGLQS